MQRTLLLSAGLLLGLLLSSPGLEAQYDPPVPPSSLTIDQAVEIALRRNPQIDVIDARLRGAEATQRAAFGEFLPSLSVSAGYQRSLTDGTVVIEGTPIPGNRAPNTWYASGGANLLLFDGFGRSAAHNRATYNVDATAAERDRLRATLTWQVQSAFLAALQAEQTREIAEVEVAQLQEQLTRLQGQIEGGVALEYLASQQEAEIASAQLSVLEATNEARSARNQLSLILNFDPEDEFTLSSVGLAESIEESAREVARESLGNLETLLQEQLEDRSDLRALRLAVSAAQAGVTVARSNYFPSVSASLRWNWNRTGEIRSDDGSLGVGLQYALFDGFRRDEAVELAQAGVVARRAELREAELRARASLEDAWQRLQNAEQRLDAAGTAVRASLLARNVAFDRFEAGLGNYSEYLLANSGYQRARLRQLAATYAWRETLYEIEYLVGR